MIIDFFVKLLMSEWKKFLIGTVIASLAGLLWLKGIQLDSVKADLKTSEALVKTLQSEKTAAIEATERVKREYDEAVAEAKRNTKTLVEQAEKNAYANFKKRYGSSLCSGYVGGVRLPTAPATGSSADEGSRKPDEASGEWLAAPAEFINACGRDAARLNALIQLCIDAKCEVVE